METYIALLRGINVAGQKKMPMAILRDHFEQWGFTAVQTYIQSGNIVFKYPTKSPEEIAASIQQHIQMTYGFEVPVMVIRPARLEKILANNPFIEDKDPKRIYLTFLSAVPAVDRVQALTSQDFEPEEYRIVEQHIYFFSPQSYGRAKMNNNFFEKKLKVNATTRNWRTSNKLLEMADLVAHS